MKSNEKEIHLSWIWISMGGVLLILGGVLFTFYGRSLGPVSHEHAAWSSFGSLLSGFFTLTGTVATIATLLFLNKQNQDQQKVTQAQISAMTFEQYINHRKLFMDRLLELQVTFENQLLFSNGEKLYRELFPNNRPTNLEFIVKPIQTEAVENLLGRLGGRLARLDEMLDKSHWKEDEVQNLVLLLLNVHGDLHIRWDGEAFDGDVFFLGKNTGINIYSVDEFLGRAKAIYNSLLFYTGNTQFEGLQKGGPRYVREALIKFFNGRHRLRDGVDVLKNIPGLEVMERLLFLTEELRGSDGNWIMLNTFRTLESAFESRESVVKLRDDLFVNTFVSIGFQEASMEMLNIGEDDKNYSKLKHCTEEMTNKLIRHR